MPPIKSLDRISKKWIEKASQAQGEYTEGIQNPKTDWMRATAAAETNYEQGVQKAIQNKRFGKGVAKSGSQKWQANSLAKGPSRWAEGIALSADEYQKGFSPFRDVIEKIVLPPRGPKGDPKNLQRVIILAKALHDAKLARTGS
ncbi:hypothetical protein LCGC14_1151100 [marine sediment metagenome]|uniref:Uncharacterized protein n=1 Tax=marine sediment metagenome TaxID=412755 RepID=A0A0F9LVE8_9ZZZZ